MSRIPRSETTAPDEEGAPGLVERLRETLDEHLPGGLNLPGRIQPGVNLSERLPGGESLAERLPGGESIAGRVPGSDRLPGTATTRRTVLAGIGGFGLGIGAASPDAVGNAVRTAGFGGGEPVVDPAATAGEPHGAAMDLVPRSAATHRATAGGRWDDPGTWVGGAVPDDGARVLIEDGAEVTVASREAARLKTVRVDGVLSFATGTDSHLQVETLVTAPGSLLRVGTPDDPVGPDAEARLTFADLGPIDEDADPERLGTGLLAMGAVAVHGATTTTWTALERVPRAGEGTLELPEPPTGWGLGDRLVVAGLDPVEDQDEEAVVVGVDGATVELDRTLDHDHVPPADDLDAYVLNLSRSVGLDSENGAVPRRGHVMFMSDEVDVRYAGFYDLGRTDKSYPFTDPIHGKPPEDVPPNPKARYALHFHETGIDTEEPARIEGVAVHGSPGWGVVNHHSHADVLDSVTYDVFGAGFVAEAGNERGSFRRNFALRSAGSGEVPDSRAFHGGDRTGKVDDFGHGGHGFWLQGPAVEVEGNVAAGHRHYGFVFWNRPLVDRELRPGEQIRDRRGTVPNFPTEHADLHESLEESERVSTGRISSAYVPIQRFQDNTVFASGGGLDVSRHMFGYDHTRFDDYGLIEAFTAYEIGPLVRDRESGRVVEPHRGNAQGGNNGITVRYSHNLRVRGARLLAGAESDLEEATGGVGINRNTPYPFNVVVEDSVVEGFDRGINAMTRGTYVVRNTRLDNDTNLRVHEHDGGPDRRVAAEGLSAAGGAPLSVALEDLDDTDPEQLFTADRGGIEFEGRPVYLDAQRPDAVPVPHEKALQKLGGRGGLEELTGGDPEGVVGKTNRQLRDDYGIAVHGTVAPPEAEDDPRVEGGLLGPAGDGEPPVEVWIEAESGSIEEPFRVESDPGASGGEYVVARAVDSHREPPDGGYATYEFEADAGEYVVHGRVLAESGSDDSFWVRMDDGEWHRWNGIRARRGWRWAPVWDSDSDRDGPVRFDLDRGEHRLQVAFREDGTKLDRLLVTALDTTPVWIGEPLAGDPGGATTPSPDP